MYKPGSKTGAVLLRRKCSQAVHPTRTFSSRQPQSKSLPPQTTQAVPGTERNLSLMVHFVEKFVADFSWFKIPGGAGTQLLWLPQEKDDTEECLMEKLLLLPKCRSLMGLIRSLLKIQQVKRQFCFLPEGLVWE